MLTAKELLIEHSNHIDIDLFMKAINELNTYN